MLIKLIVWFLKLDVNALSGRALKRKFPPLRSTGCSSLYQNSPSHALACLWPLSSSVCSDHFSYSVQAFGTKYHSSLKFSHWSSLMWEHHCYHYIAPKPSCFNLQMSSYLSGFPEMELESRLLQLISDSIQEQVWGNTQNAVISNCTADRLTLTPITVQLKRNYWFSFSVFTCWGQYWRQRSRYLILVTCVRRVTSYLLWKRSVLSSVLRGLGLKRSWSLHPSP